MFKLVKLGFLFAVLLAAGCGGAGSNGGLVTGTFMGTASDGRTQVAIVAEPSGGTGRTIQAFAGDGVGSGTYFTGSANGNLFDLHSATNDEEISGTLDSFGATANLALSPDLGISVSGTATAGPTGLFLVSLVMPSGSVAGSVSGTSTTGAQLTGTIDPTRVGNSFAVSGTITAPGGSPVNFSAFVSNNSSGQQHWIVMPDESVYGAGVDGAVTGVTGPVPREGPA